MPKRIVDSALYRSDKLAAIQPPAFRAEYANLIPLTLANGTFECTPRLVWAEAYSYNRPEVTLEIVEALLDELVRVKLLFRFKADDGKQWGYWVGISKPGRLPAPSRLEKGFDKQGAPVPEDLLAAFLGTTGPQSTASGQLAGSYVGIGSGSGLGSGKGLGVGLGTGSGNGVNQEPIRPILAETSKPKIQTQEPEPVNPTQPINLASRVAALLKRYPRDPNPGEAASWPQKFEDGILRLADQQYDGDVSPAADHVEHCVQKLIAYVLKEGKDRKYTYAPEKFFQEWVPKTYPSDKTLAAEHVPTVPKPDDSDEHYELEVFN